jgi:hypothetical protein
MNPKPTPTGGGPAHTPSSRDEKVWSGGDFVDKPTKGIQREIAQRQFLELARDLYHVTADLRDNVLPHYAKAANAFDESRVSSELQKWFDRYKLGRPWVVAQVRETLTLWTLFPDVARLSDENPPWHPLFHIVKRRPRPADTVPFVFTFLCPTFEITSEGTVNRLEPAGWDVELDRREDFVTEARRQFEEKLKDHCDEQERSAEARGLVPIKRRRKREISLRTKMTWAVRRRCGEMGFEEIASAHYQDTCESVDVSTVIKSVKEILVLTDLEEHPKSRHRS